MSKERDPAVYQSVTSSPLLIPSCGYVYWALWGARDGLTRGEVSKVCTDQGWQEDKKNTWSKAVSLLAKMGLVEKTTKKHCPVVNKEEQVWEVTNRAVPIKPKADKPSGKAFVRAVEQLELLILHHKSAGDGLVTEDLQKLYDWVRDKLPSA